MNNSSQDVQLFYGISKVKKITLGKRVLIYFVDFFFFLILYFAIFYSAGVRIISAVSQEAISGLNSQIALACQDFDYPYGPGSDFGIFELKEDEFIDDLQTAHPELSEQDCYDLFFEADNKLNSSLSTNTQYIKFYSEFHRNYLLTDAACMLVPNLILIFLIPLYNRENRTLGMMIFKTTLTDSKDCRQTSKYKHIPRFVIFFLELFITKVVFNYYSFITLPLMELVVMISTPKRQTIYDALSFTRVVNSESVDRSPRQEEYHIPTK